jgi:hypothetical protein
LRGKLHYMKGRYFVNLLVFSCLKHTSIAIWNNTKIRI